MESDSREINVEGWRDLGDLEQIQFIQWVCLGLNGRLQKGEERYQSHIHGFQGDPLQHLEEELLDALLYLWVEKRKQGIV